MNRRELLIGSGVTLTMALAGCSSDQSTEPSDNSTNSTDDQAADFSVTYNWKRYEKLTTPDSDGWYLESNEEDQYVGAQIQVTNETDEDLTIGEYELAVMAGNNGEDISFRGDSKLGPLESIGAGETVATYLVFRVPANTDLEFGPTQWADHSFDLERDESLEIELEEYEG